MRRQTKEAAEVHAVLTRTRPTHRPPPSILTAASLPATHRYATLYRENSTALSFFVLMKGAISLTTLATEDRPAETTELRVAPRAAVGVCFGVEALTGLARRTTVSHHTHLGIDRGFTEGALDLTSLKPPPKPRRANTVRAPPAAAAPARSTLTRSLALSSPQPRHSPHPPSQAHHGPPRA